MKTSKSDYILLINTNNDAGASYQPLYNNNVTTSTNYVANESLSSVVMKAYNPINKLNNKTAAIIVTLTVADTVTKIYNNIICVAFC